MTGATAAPLLIDRLMPAHEVTAVRHALVDAPPEEAYRILRDVDLMDVGARAPAARGLMALRGLADALARRLGGRPAPAGPERLPLAEPERMGWIMLGERPPEELVVGAVGRFWTPSIEWRPVAAADFAAFAAPGYGKIAWGFSIRPYGERRSLLTTECRTAATDPVTARRIRRYWRLVGPFATYIIGLTPRLVGERAAARSLTNVD